MWNFALYCVCASGCRMRWTLYTLSTSIYQISCYLCLSLSLPPCLSLTLFRSVQSPSIKLGTWTPPLETKEETCVSLHYTFVSFFSFPLWWMHLCFTAACMNGFCSECHITCVFDRLGWKKSRRECDWAPDLVLQLLSMEHFAVSLIHLRFISHYGSVMIHGFYKCDE